jgi:hypothetical protein
MESRIESSSIPVDAYLKYALSLTTEEKELIKEFSKWLPNEVVDVHVHTNTKNQYIFMDSYYFSRAVSPFHGFQ